MERDLKNIILKTGKRGSRVKRKLVEPISIWISSFLLMISGLFLLINSNMGMDFLLMGARAVLIVLGLLMILSIFFKREDTILSNIIGGSLYLLFGLCIYFCPNLFESSLYYVVGIWTFINFLWRLILCTQLHINKDREFFRTAVECVISLLFSIVFLFFRPENVNFVCIFLGIYLVFYGLNMFIDFISELLYWDKDGGHIKRHIKWAPSVLLIAFIPHRLIDKINKKVKVESKGNEFFELSKKNIKDEDIKLEVFIHMAPQIAMGFGHMDVCLNDTVYSYSTYDSDAKKCFGLIADGVLAKMNREKYIKHCLKVDNEDIVSFSILINDEQEKRMKNYINEVTGSCTEWRCKSELDPDQQYNDPASIFYRDADAKFYKFKKGRYKTYFAVSTNCVMLADKLLGSAGVDGIAMNGIITPGTYLSFLNEEFRKKNTIVVKRRVLA